MVLGTGGGGVHVGYTGVYIRHIKVTREGNGEENGS